MPIQWDRTGNHSAPLFPTDREQAVFERFTERASRWSYWPRKRPASSSTTTSARSIPLRIAARRGGPRSPRARVTRHHSGARARSGRPHRRLRRRGSPRGRFRSPRARRRCSSWRCVKRCRSGTTTSARSILRRPRPRERGRSHGSSWTSTPTRRRSATRSSGCLSGPGGRQGRAPRRAGPRARSRRSSKLLDQFERLTKLAAESKLDPVVGREQVERIADPLAAPAEERRC